MWILPAFVEAGSPVLQGVYGTCFTWFVTALGSGVVFLVPDGLSEAAEGKILDVGLGAAAGIMLAASFWSLLAPSIEMAEAAGYGPWSFVPAATGFLAGCLFVFGADLVLPEDADDVAKLLETASRTAEEEPARAGLRQRKPARGGDRAERAEQPSSPSRGSRSATAAAAAQTAAQRARSWRRLMLLVIAVTIHNFPEGLAVGVGFGAVGTSESATLQAAELLTFGIGIQNFPEGLAVSLPMRRMGYSRKWCFFYGQLSGMVEPLGGLLGAAAVQYATPVLPFALAFAAGAMIYVVVDSIVPEAQTRGNSTLATWGAMFGFLVMMALDVSLG